MRAAAVAALVLLASCRRGEDAAILAVDVAACQPLSNGAVVGSSLRNDAPTLAGGRRFRCLVFPGTASHRLQLTVFADGFTPSLYLLEPGEPPHRLVARSTASDRGGVARASAVLPRTRPYAAVVLGETGEGGTFLLSVQDQP